MKAKLRADLRLSTEEIDGEKTHILFDPVSGREFVWDDLQFALIRALGAGRSLADLQRWATDEMGQGLQTDELLAFINILDALGLLEADLTADEIRERQRETKRSHAREQQGDAFVTLLDRVQTDIPYYRELLQDLSIEIDTVDDVRRLPRLSKDTLRQQFQRFLSEEAREDQILLSTSGTTNERLQLISTADYGGFVATGTLNMNEHIRCELKAKGLRFCTLTTPICSGTECHVGVNIPLEERIREPELVLESRNNMISFPDDGLDKMVREINEFRPDYVLGDPVYLAVLARHIIRHRPKLVPISFVMASYELCSDIHRRLAQEAFQAPLFELYGAFEFGWVAMQCHRGAYHVNGQAAILEIVDDGQHVAPGEVGEILVTTLEKPLMPLLRYETGDLARAASEPCACAYGHTTTYAAMEGRKKDVIATVDGRLLTPRAVDSAVAAASDSIAFYQLAQLGAETYRLSVVTEHGIDDRLQAALTRSLTELLGARAALRIQQVRELMPEPSGKFRLSCRLDQEPLR